jgi:hypothetical protein
MNYPFCNGLKIHGPALVGPDSLGPVLPEFGAHPTPGRLQAIEPIDSFVVDQPALPLQEGVNPPVVITLPHGGNLLDPLS